jgi:hypothetical protein
MALPERASNSAGRPDQPKRRPVGGKASWCTQQAAFFSLGDNRPVCFYEQPGNPGSFDRVWIARYLESTGTFDIQPIRYASSKDIAGGGFKSELLYEGVSGGTLRLSYREYIDSLARPAFQQELTYTLSPTPPTDIAFRGVRISVDAADKNSIRYRVLSGFRPRQATP